jgi:hypothetical protein
MVLQLDDQSFGYFSELQRMSGESLIDVEFVNTEQYVVR